MARYSPQDPGRGERGAEGKMSAGIGDVSVRSTTIWALEQVERELFRFILPVETWGSCGTR